MFTVVLFSGVPLGKAAHRNPGSTTGGRLGWNSRQHTVNMPIPYQAGCFGPPLAQEKAVPNEDLHEASSKRSRPLASRTPQDLLREATSLCEELASVVLCSGCALHGALEIREPAGTDLLVSLN